MPKIVLAAPVESIQGKLGGSTIRKTRSGHMLTGTFPPTQRRTAAEAFIRGNLNNVAGDWAALSDPQHEAWNKYASMLDASMSGFNAFVRVNTRLLNADHPSLTQISWPASTPATPNAVRGFAAESNGTTTTLTWTGPNTPLQWVQVQYSPQVAFSMSGKRRWATLPAVVASALTGSHSYTLPSGYSLYYRARTIDNRGRVSPWTVDTLCTEAAEPWLPGYAHRKKINLSAGSAEAGTGYQVLLKIGETSGASGEHFDLEGEAQNFGVDLRFTAADMETLLPYWLKETTGSPPNELATLRVKVAANLSSPQSIYVYYGKDGDTSASSGVNTFNLFKDFSDTENGQPPVGWTVHSGTFTVTDGVLYCPSTDSNTHKCSCDQSHGLQNYVFYCEFGIVTAVGGEANIWYKEANENDTYRLKSYSSDQVLHTEAGDNTETLARSSNGDWWFLEFFVLQPGTIQTYYESEDAGQGRVMVHDVEDLFTATEGRVGLGDYATSVKFDNVRVRKYAATEPAFLSAGVQEDAP
jgi:hypothetical protein